MEVVFTLLSALWMLGMSSFVFTGSGYCVVCLSLFISNPIGNIPHSERPVYSFYNGKVFFLILDIYFA